MRKRFENQRFTGNRSKIIMMNAGVILLVIVIAMVIQLVNLNRKGKQKKDSIQQTEVEKDVSTEVTVKPTKKPEVKKQGIPVIRKNLDDEKPMVALTFDDGPYDKVTNRIVKVLDKYDSRATFFVVGNRVDRYSTTLKNAFDHGNQIATHTYDHGDLSRMNKAAIKREISKSLKAVKKVTGSVPALLRPPYGNVNDKVRKNVGLPMIYWSVDSEDWKSRNKKKIIQRCKKIKDGDIVLMHDLYTTTADAIEKLVPALVKKGYQLVTVEELFYYKGIQTENGKVYYSGW